MDIKIRKGSDKDLPKVLEMVKDLAAFEKEPEAVTAKLEDYASRIVGSFFSLLKFLARVIL